MASVLKIVDPANTSTVLFDLNTTVAAANPASLGGVKTDLRGDVNWGAPTWEFDRFEPDGGGGQTTFTRAGLTQSTLNVRIYGAANTDNFLLGVNALSFLLARGCTLLWIPQGGTITRYYDIEPTQTPALLGGQPMALYQALSALDTPEGVTLSLTRQPFSYRDELNPVTNVLINPTMLADSDANGTPDGWTLINGTFSIVTAQNAFQAVHNAAVDIINQDFSAAAGTQFTGSIEALRVSGDRTPSLKLVSRPSGAQVGTVDITATAWGTRVSATGTIAGGDTSMRLKLTYTGGSASTTIQARNAQLEIGSAPSTFRVGDQVIPNDPSSSLGRSALFYNAGTAPAPVRVAVIGDSGSLIAAARVGLRSDQGRDGSAFLADYLNSRKFLQCESGTNGTDTTSQSSSGASGGNAKRTTYGTVTGWAKRVTLTPTTLLDTLRGEYDVHATVKALTVGSVHHLQLRWAPSTASPATVSLDEVLLDTTTAASAVFVDVNLGRIQVDAGAGLSGLNFELWSRIETGSGSLDWDALHFVPADESLGKNYILPTASVTTWSALELSTPSLATIAGDPALILGTYDASSKVVTLAASGAGTGNPPGSAGTVLPQGRHTFTWKLTHSGTWSGTIVFRVVNVTAGTAVSKTITGNVLGSPQSLQIDANGTSAYQAQAYISVLVPRTSVSIISISDAVTPYLAQNERLESDAALYTVAKLDSTGKLISPAGSTGQLPVVCPPGLSVLHMTFVDVPTSGLEDYDAITNARTPTVRLTYSPQDFL